MKLRYVFIRSFWAGLSASLLIAFVLGFAPGPGMFAFALAMATLHATGVVESAANDRAWQASALNDPPIDAREPEPEPEIRPIARKLQQMHNRVWTHMDEMLREEAKLRQIIREQREARQLLWVALSAAGRQQLNAIRHHHRVVIPLELAGRWIAMSPDKSAILGDAATFEEIRSAHGDDVIFSRVPDRRVFKPSPINADANRAQITEIKGEGERP